MEDNCVAVRHGLLANSLVRVLAVQGVHPARERAVGKLTQSYTVLGEGLKVVAGGIGIGDLILVQNQLDQIPHRSVLVYRIGLLLHPGLQIIAGEGMHIVILAMGTVTQNREADLNGFRNRRLFQRRQCFFGSRQSIIVCDLCFLCIGQSIVTRPGSGDGALGFQRHRRANGVDQSNDLFHSLVHLGRSLSQGKDAAGIVFVVQCAIAVRDDAANTILLIVAARCIQCLLRGLGAIGFRFDDIDAAGIVVVSHIQIDIAVVHIICGQQHGALGIGRFVDIPEDRTGAGIHSHHTLVAAPAAHTDVSNAIVYGGGAGGVGTVSGAVHLGQVRQFAGFPIQVGPAKLRVVSGKEDSAVVIADGGANLFANAQRGNQLTSQFIPAGNGAIIIAADDIVTCHNRAGPVIALGIHFSPDQTAIVGIQADKGILFAVSEAYIDLPVGIGDGALGLTAVFIGVDPQGFQSFGVERLYLAAI